MRLHTGQLPYACSYCPKKCSTNQNLNYHVRNKHTHKIDLQNRRIQLENEIFEEENQANKSIDNPVVNSEWTSEDPTYVMIHNV